MMGRYKNLCRKVLSVGLVAGLLLFGSPATVLADDYNCGAYGAGAYQSNVCGDSGLADTGQPIWPFLLAVLLILLGTYVLYRTRKKMKQKTTHQSVSQPK